jgi:hypothetical protein
MLDGFINSVLISPNRHQDPMQYLRSVAGRLHLAVVCSISLGGCTGQRSEPILIGDDVRSKVFGPFRLRAVVDPERPSLADSERRGVTRCQDEGIVMFGLTLSRSSVWTRWNCSPTTYLAKAFHLLTSHTYYQLPYDSACRQQSSPPEPLSGPEQH